MRTLTRWITLLTICVVTQQSRTHCGWLTSCESGEEISQVVLPSKVVPGKAVVYKPYIHGDESIIHGAILDVSESVPRPAKVALSSDTGKAP